MDNIKEMITQVLQDPQQMQQISDIAASLGLTGSDTDGSVGNVQFPAEISRILTQSQEKDQKQQALVRALLPYLHPNKQRKLEQAIRIARLSHLAGAALQNEQPIVNQEDSYDV